MFVYLNTRLAWNDSTKTSSAIIFLVRKDDTSLAFITVWLFSTGRMCNKLCRSEDFKRLSTAHLARARGHRFLCGYDLRLDRPAGDDVTRLNNTLLFSLDWIKSHITSYCRMLLKFMIEIEWCRKGRFWASTSILRCDLWWLWKISLLN